MKLIASATTLLVLGSASLSAMAVNGATATFNEAVRIVDGKRVVDVAPFPPRLQTLVKGFKKPGEEAGDWPVTSIETPEGLMDCTGTRWYHPKACSPSTFGKEPHERTWMVKMRGQWFACGSFASVKTCEPFIIDGTLRPVPSSRE